MTFRDEIEQEIERRVNEQLTKRLSIEINNRNEAIEAEVQKRLIEAKKIMEKDLLEEANRQKQIELKKQLEKEVMNNLTFDNNTFFFLLFHILKPYKQQIKIHNF